MASAVDFPDSLPPDPSYAEAYVLSARIPRQVKKFTELGGLEELDVSHMNLKSEVFRCHRWRGGPFTQGSAGTAKHSGSVYQLGAKLFARVLTCGRLL